MAELKFPLRTLCRKKGYIKGELQSSLENSTRVHLMLYRDSERMCRSYAKVAVHNHSLHFYLKKDSFKLYMCLSLKICFVGN